MTRIAVAEVSLCERVGSSLTRSLTRSTRSLTHSTLRDEPPEPLGDCALQSAPVILNPPVSLLCVSHATTV